MLWRRAIWDGSEDRFWSCREEKRPTDARRGEPGEEPADETELDRWSRAALAPDESILMGKVAAWRLVEYDSGECQMALSF